MSWRSGSISWGGVALIVATAMLLASIGWSRPAVAQAPDAQGPGPGLELEEDSLLLGDLLYYEGDLYRALGQYKRYLLTHPFEAPARRQRVRLKMAWLYHVGERYPAAGNLLREVAAEGEGEPLGLWSTLYFGESARLGGRPDLAAGAYRQVIERCQGRAEDGGVDGQQCLALTSYGRVALAQIMASAQQFERAIAELEQIPSSSPLAPQARAIARQVEALEIPQKSPALAGLLSIIPGLGHFYLGEWGTGLVAMVWNGAFIYAIVDSILDASYGQAALIGLVELIWYGGTIFGAVAGAHRFNRDARRIVEEGMMRDLSRLADPTPWPVRFPVQPAGLQLKLRF